MDQLIILKSILMLLKTLTCSTQRVKAIEKEIQELIVHAQDEACYASERHMAGVWWDTLCPETKNYIAKVNNLDYAYDSFHWTGRTILDLYNLVHK